MFVRAALGIVLSLTAWLGWSSQETKPAAQAQPQAHAHDHGQAAQAWHVLFELGAKFDPKVDLMKHPTFADHYKFVHDLVHSGELYVGGPLLESPTSGKVTGAAMLLRGKDEKSVRERLAGDPFVTGEILKIASVRPMMAGMGTWLPKATAAPAAR